MSNYDPGFESRQSRAEHFLRAATYGPVCVALLVAAGAISGNSPDPSVPVGLVKLLATLGALEAMRRLFVDRKSDEYVESLWNSGTTAAFITLVLWLFAVTNGLFIAEKLSAPAMVRDIFGLAFRQTFNAAMLAFFLGLNWPRLRRGA